MICWNLHVRGPAFHRMFCKTCRSMRGLHASRTLVCNVQQRLRWRFRNLRDRFSWLLGSDDRLCFSILKQIWFRHWKAASLRLECVYAARKSQHVDQESRNSNRSSGRPIEGEVLFALADLSITKSSNRLMFCIVLGWNVFNWFVNGRMMSSL